MRTKGSGPKRQQMDKQLHDRVHKVAMRMGDGTVSGCSDEARHSEETLGQSSWWWSSWQRSGWSNWWRSGWSNWRRSGRSNWRQSKQHNWWQSEWQPMDSSWRLGQVVSRGRRVVWVFPLQLPPLQNCIDLMQWSVVGWGGREWSQRPKRECGGGQLGFLYGIH